jgi:hypothetical protein
MNLYQALYIVNIIDNIDKGIAVLFGIGILVLIVTAFKYFIFRFEDEDVSLELKIIKKYWILLLLMVLDAPIPSKSTMYMMLGVKYLDQSGIPKKVTEALELKLDEYIEELKDDKKNENSQKNKKPY